MLKGVPCLPVMELGTFTIFSTFVLLQLLQCVFPFVNRSVNKTADMSTSQYTDKWLADEAVDGDVRQKVAQGSCAVTSDNLQKQAWWRVDLGDLYLLNSVKIYYRKESEDQSLTYWLSGFSIYVADTLNWWIGTRCYLHNNGQHTVTGPSDILTVPCNATGRYVTVYKQRNGSCVQSQYPSQNVFCAKLELCEVQVQSCEDGTYGESCSNNCSGNCLYGVHCNKAHGGCEDGCAPGYRGFYCDEVCQHGRFGVQCNSTCSENCRNISNCRNTDGYCDVCSEGWKRRLCNEKCMPGTFGSNCSKVCGNCISSTCSNINGTCLTGCSTGWKGIYCNETCNNGFYGHQCSRTCKSCTETCHHVTGRCLVYDKQTPENDKDNVLVETPEYDKDNVIIGISVTSGIIITALSVALLLTCLRLRSQSSINRKNPTDTNTIKQEQRHAQMLNTDNITQYKGNCMNQETGTRNKLTYEDLMMTSNKTNTYEKLKPDRAITYTNTQLV